MININFKYSGLLLLQTTSPQTPNKGDIVLFPKKHYQHEFYEFEVIQFRWDFTQSTTCCEIALSPISYMDDNILHRDILNDTDWDR